MTNQEILKKMKKDMKLRNFSHYTYDSYLGKTKDMMRYFGKTIENITTEELRKFLLKEDLILNKKAQNHKKLYEKIF